MKHFVFCYSEPIICALRCWGLAVEYIYLPHIIHGEETAPPSGCIAECGVPRGGVRVHPHVENLVHPRVVVGQFTHDEEAATFCQAA